MNAGDFIRLQGSAVTDTEATGVASTIYIAKRCELQYPALYIKGTEATTMTVRIDVNGVAGAGGSIVSGTGDLSAKVLKDESKRGLVLKAGDKVEFNITVASTDDKLFEAVLIVRDLYENAINEPTNIEK